MDSECWRWTGSHDQAGYGLAPVRIKRVHRLAYEAQNGPIPHGMMVLHSCDVRDCINPKHLRLGTQRENCADAVSRDRNCRGERNGRHVLTADEVKTVRRLVREGTPQKNLAYIYGVTPAAINLVVKRKNWAWLDE